MSTNHYLVCAWDEILRSLDQENSACALISVDFAKAFNTMCHVNCVKRIRDMGASASSTEIIQAFLHDRRMQFKIGSTLSSKRLLKGGAPQGTLLGNFLFILATDNLEIISDQSTVTCSVEDPGTDSIKHPSPDKSPSPSVPQPSSFSDPDSPTAQSISSDNAWDASPATSPVPGPSRPARPIDTSTPSRRPLDDRPVQGVDDSFSYFREFRRPTNRIDDTREDITINTLNGSQMMLLQPAKDRWIERDPATSKYVDDFLASEHLPVTCAYNIFSTAKPKSFLTHGDVNVSSPRSRPMLRGLE